jgi:Flp pilus assembly protein TadG
MKQDVSTLLKAAFLRNGSRAQGHRGQTVVEFALVVPVFLLLVFGVLDFGRAVYEYNTIVNAARQGARYGIINFTDGPGIKAAAKAAAGPLGIADANITIRCFAYGSSSGSVTQTCTTVTPGDQISVQVDYAYTSLMSTFLKVAPTINLTSTSRMIVQ